MKILQKLAGALSGAESAAVRADLVRLEDVQRGLGNSAIGFVLQGKNETVLSSLHTLKPECLHIGVVRWDDREATEKRRWFLSSAPDPDPEVLTRYARLLSAGFDPKHEDQLSGSAAVPLDVRLFLSEVFMGVANLGHTAQPTLNPDRALDMVDRLGGTVTDFFDMLYEAASEWNRANARPYREKFDIRDTAEAHKDAFAEAMMRVSASARVEMIRAVSGWQWQNDSFFLPRLIEAAGDSAKSVREAAMGALAKADPAETERLATAALDGGTVNTRAAMVQILGSVASDSAVATLEAHREGEKTARILSAIDTALAAREMTAAVNEAGEDDATGYIAIDGTRVEIPPVREPETGAMPAFGDGAELTAAIEAENERIRTNNAARKKEHPKAYMQPTIDPKIAGRILLWLKGGDAPLAGRKRGTNAERGFLFHSGVRHIQKMLDRLPEAARLKAAATLAASEDAHMIGHWQTLHGDIARGWLDGERGDLRVIDRLEVEAGIHHRSSWRDKGGKAQPGDLLRSFLNAEWWSLTADTMPRDAVWPYVAENFDVMAEALGLGSTQARLSKSVAVGYLATLPKTPMRFVAPLLEIATGTAKSGRAEARALLENAPGVTERLIALLDDGRQDVRAGAAQWLGTRGDREAIDPIKKRLKKEKSEIARAGMLGALDALGEDLSPWLGLDALVRDAEATLKKAKLDKLDWLALDQIPAMKLKTGETLPADVARAWIALAVKLKEPGGNALFDLYLDRLDPEDAEKFSGWIFDAWINYDTTRPPEDEANTYAKQHAKSQAAMYRRWDPNYTEEIAFANLKREFMSNLPNSGAATKGLLALAKKVPPARSAQRVRAYLKEFGKRTSQASALLEMLAAKGDTLSLQVVIAAATRLKQKGVQKFAGELVERVADSHGWTADELADRTVPSAGLNDDGILELPVGPDEKLYTAILDDDLKLELRNPDGKIIKALPSGEDDATKESKKQLSGSKKEMKQVIQMQAERLYEALCAERTWDMADWQRDFRDHPVMRRLTERTVWIGLDADGEPMGAFRPTAEGDMTNAEDDTVDTAAFSRVRLAHGALLSKDEAAAWQQHLEDYEVKPLFAQFGRPLLTAEGEMSDARKIEDRKGWVSDTFTIRGMATKLGYDRGEVIDGGFYDTYWKPFKSAGLAAVLTFTGDAPGMENQPAATVSMSFHTLRNGRDIGQEKALSDVPPVLLSEAWNDYHAIAAKGAFDPEWEKRAAW